MSFFLRLEGVIDAEGNPSLSSKVPSEMKVSETTSSKALPATALLELFLQSTEKEENVT